MYYEVTVRPGYRYPTAQVSGKIFSKRSAVSVSKSSINDEILYSELLDVVEVDKESTEINATSAAIELAKNEGVDLSQVVGTGNDGRITKADVEDHLNNNAIS